MKDKMKKLYQRKTVLKIHNNKKYKCYDPKESISPLGYEFIETVHDDDTYIIDRIKRPQDENPCLAVRWYIANSEYVSKADSEKICTGYPNSRGYPTWFILPNTMPGDVYNYMIHHNNTK